MQVASTKWFLGVQIQHFDNNYNAEMINGIYCCCHDNEICSNNLNTLLGNCTHPHTAQPCETYFFLHIRDCMYNDRCLHSKTYQLNYTSSASTFDNGVLSIPLTDIELSDEVRRKISYLLKLSAKFWNFAINSLYSGALLSNCAVLIIDTVFPRIVYAITINIWNNE